MPNNNNFISELMELEDVIITTVEVTKTARHIHIEMPRRIHQCPACGRETDRIHDYREQVIKDIPYMKDSYLHLRKRRYVCSECSKRFYEDVPFLPRYYRMTNRMVGSILHDFSKVKSASQIAREHNVSVTTAIRYFDYVSYKNRSLPEVLSIDEFKGNAGGEKYQCIVTDAKNKKILDILPNRKEYDLIRYFKAFSTRNSVKYFVTDMNPHFKEVAKACFPKAVIIADRYHVTRQVMWAMERVRKVEQKRLSQKHRRYFKRSRYLLCKNELNEEETQRLALMFEIAPRLATAYYLKNKFLDVMHSKNSYEAKKKLADWMLLAEFEHMPEFDDCITAYRNWSQEILNAIDYPWSNGFTEGCNNKTKVLKRTCYGVQNFERFRNRILHCAA